MKTVVLIIINFDPIESYNVVAKNEPNKLQVMELVSDIAKELGKEGKITYEQYQPVGSCKMYLLKVGSNRVVVRVQRETIIEFAK